MDFFRGAGSFLPVSMDRFDMRNTNSCGWMNPTSSAKGVLMDSGYSDNRQYVKLCLINSLTRYVDIRHFQRRTASTTSNGTSRLSDGPRPNQNLSQDFCATAHQTNQALCIVFR